MNNDNSIKKKHFVFDLDDTLVDGRTFCGETIARVITTFDPKQDFLQIKMIHDANRGITIKDHYLKILEMLNLELDLDKLLEMDQEIQNKEHYRLKIFDGVIDIFEFLKSKGKQIHMCTNRTKKTLIPVLKFNKIEKYFSTIISCADEGFKKPNPKCLNDIILASKDQHESFTYFGDSEIDSEFAKNAKIDFIIFDQYLNENNLFKKLIKMFIEK